MCRGARGESIDLRRATTAELALALGPSGNLRAPALKVGAHWLVGFAPQPWEQVFG